MLNKLPGKIIEDDPKDSKIVVGITGASGTVLAVKFLENIKDAEVHLVMSDSARKVMLAWKLMRQMEP